jgi:hypothetical protein
MYPKYPKQEESSKTHVFIGNSRAVCSPCVLGRVYLWEEVNGQKGGGLRVREKTVLLITPPVLLPGACVWGQ